MYDMCSISDIRLYMFDVCLLYVYGVKGGENAMSQVKCKYYARKRGDRVTGGDIHFPSEFANAEDFPLADGDAVVAKINEEGNIVIMPETKGAWIWAIAEGGLNWITHQIKERKVALFHYAIHRAPQQGEYLVFYSNKHLIGRIYVAAGARKLTTAEKNEDPSIRMFNYVMALDGNDFEIFQVPIPIESIKDAVSVFKGVDASRLHSKSRLNPRIDIEDYNRILKIKENLKSHQK